MEFLYTPELRQTSRHLHGQTSPRAPVSTCRLSTKSNLHICIIYLFYLYRAIFLVVWSSHVHKNQGWGAGKFFSGSGSGSWLFFSSGSGSGSWFFFPSGSGSWFFFKRLRLQGAKNTRLRPAPAPDYWLSLPKYSFPHNLVR